MLGKMSLEDAQNRLNEVADNILNATSRVLEVVERLKSFGRADGPKTEKVDIVAAIKNAVSMTITQIRDVEETKIELDDNLEILIQGSQVEYEQVLINMIMNAVYAIEKRRVMESASYKGSFRIWLDSDENNVVVSISDNGTGMNKGTAGKIYTPYFTTKERGKGTGLGLSISHGIISKYNGKIEVQSTPMQGTIFRIILPLIGRG